METPVAGGRAGSASEEMFAFLPLPGHKGAPLWGGGGGINEGRDGRWRGLYESPRAPHGPERRTRIE